MPATQNFKAKATSINSSSDAGTTKHQDPCRPVWSNVGCWPKTCLHLVHHRRFYQICSGNVYPKRGSWNCGQSHFWKTGSVNLAFQHKYTQMEVKNLSTRSLQNCLNSWMFNILKLCPHIPNAMLRPKFSTKQ